MPLNLSPAASELLAQCNEARGKYTSVAVEVETLRRAIVEMGVRLEAMNPDRTLGQLDPEEKWLKGFGDPVCQSWNAGWRRGRRGLPLEEYVITPYVDGYRAGCDALAEAVEREMSA